MIIIKSLRYIALFLATSLFLSQQAALCKTIAAAKKDNGNTLVIRHIAIAPDGSRQVLGTETIENITDIYYYQASASPIASRFLKGGYSLSDRKNRLIEADVAASDGKIDLEYTPSVQNVNVTYYKNENGNEVKMGTITDSAYLGQEYTPQMPVYEDSDVLAELIGDTKYIVGLGENNFKVSYRLAENVVANAADSAEENDNSIFSDETTAMLTSVRLNRDAEFIAGYSDNTFRPDDYLTKADFFTLLYRLASGNSNNISWNGEKALDFLRDRKIVEENEETGGTVTWSEFLSYISRLNYKLPQDERLADVESDYWKSYFEKDKQVRRGEAVAVINEMLDSGRSWRIRRSSALGQESPVRYKDIDESHWAYEDIGRLKRKTGESIGNQIQEDASQAN